MQRSSRSLRFYLAIALVYAVLAYLVVQLVHDWELSRIGLLAPGYQPRHVIVNALTVHTISFGAWLVLSAVAATAAHRIQSTLVSALSAERQRTGELALISDVAAALSGPLAPAEIAAEFLRRMRGALGEQATGVVVLYDSAADSFAAIGADGPRAQELRGKTCPAKLLPPALHVKLLERREVVIAEAATGDASPAMLGAHFPAPHAAGGFGMVPLVSRDRMVGPLVVLEEAPRAPEAERLQLLTIVAHHLAGALDNALSVAEAEARAVRAAAIGRVVERARASLNPDQVLSTTVEEIGRAVAASRAIVRLAATEDDLRGFYEWTADGVRPIGSLVHEIPIASCPAMREGRTVAVSDVRQEPLPDPALGRREELLRTGTYAALATPLILGGRLTGMLVLH